MPPMLPCLHLDAYMWMLGTVPPPLWVTQQVLVPLQVDLADLGCALLNSFSRQQHHASLQWSKACARQERIRRGLASNEAGGGNERAIGTTGNATRKLDARLDHARRAVKVAIQSGVGQTRRHQQVCTHLLAAQTMRDYTS